MTEDSAAYSIRPSLPLSLSLAAFVVYLAVVVLLQWTNGAYQAEFGGHPDEAAHYVTGLMIRDYIASGLPGNPMRFAVDYYDHYPKVALGNWPPLFYVIQSGWTLLFTPSRASVLLLMAVLTSLIATITMRALAEEFKRPLAFFGGLLVTAFPLVQLHTAMVMTEVPVALFTLLAVVSFGRYLDRVRPLDAILFGLFASAAILTKGSGLSLALIPILSIVLTGRYDLLKQKSFWYPVPIVALLGGPWTWYFRNVASAGWQEKSISLGYIQRAAPHFPAALVNAASLAIAAFAIVGLVATVVALRRGAAPRRWAAPAALVVSVLLFHIIVPASLDRRHIIPALPAWAMFCVAGTAWIAHAAARNRAQLQWAVYAVAVAALLHTVSRAPGKHSAGFGRIVTEVVNHEDDANGRFLVSSDATGEGMFIAETAMADDRPEHVVRRASKLLASQEWDGSGYQSRVQGATELVALLKQERVRFLVIDETIPASLLAPHHTLLRKTAESEPDLFTLRSSYPVIRDYLAERPGAVVPEGIRLYEVREGAPATSVQSESGGR